MDQQVPWLRSLPLSPQRGIATLFRPTAALAPPRRVGAWLIRPRLMWRGGHERGSGMMENYGIIGWIVIGLLAGGLAKLLMPGRDPGGCIITILLGIAGALLAGFLGRAVGWYEPNEGAGFIAPIVGTRLDISATGEVTRVPDVAIISAGVVTRSPTASAAIQENSARMDRVF